MTDSEDLNRALEKAEELAERFIEQMNLDYDYFEHDLFYGNPDAALTDIFFVLDHSNRMLSEKDFTEAIDLIGIIRGKIESNDISRRYAHLIHQ